MSEPTVRKILIVAGEASGDMHAADLIAALNRLAAQNGGVRLHFYGLGGSTMREAGVAPLIGMEQVSVIGLFEVVRHFPRIWTTFQDLVRSLDRERPDLVILIDFPDFNLRLAKKIKKRGIPLVWYISPQVWAWRSERVHDLKRLVDRMLVLFPFEPEFYRRYGMDVTFVGHPLVDRVAPSASSEVLRRELGLPSDARVVALLPGSRRSELRMYLEPMFKAAEILAARDTSLRFVLPLARSLSPDLIQPALAGCHAPIIWQTGRSYDLTALADTAVVASGTATLETALIGTPMVILGRVSRLTELWLRRVANLPYYGLVNFVMGQKTVTELIQRDVTPERISAEVERLLYDDAERLRLKTCYAEIRARLGAGGAAERAAQAVFEML